MSRRRQRLLMYGALVAVLLLAFLAREWRLRALVERPQLPVAFEHFDHAGEACADCHHNFIDDTGGGPCYHCHKVTPEIAAEIEPMFHDFCRGCHVATRLEGEDSGPLRECSGCHH